MYSTGPILQIEPKKSTGNKKCRYMKDEVKTIKKWYDSNYNYQLSVCPKRLGRFLDPLGITEQLSYLDIGCGAGDSLYYGLRRTEKVSGLDLSESALRASKGVFGDSLQLVCGDGQSLPFADKAFDRVSALGVIEHFPEPFKGVGEIERVLKDNGTAVIVVPNSYGLFSKLNLYKGTSQIHEELHTYSEWRRVLEDKGLSVISCKSDRGYALFKYKNPLRILKSLLMKVTLVLPVQLAYQFIFVCRKQGFSPAGKE